MNNEIFYFPGWTRKAISFTIDDGNVPLDKKFLSIVKPAGILGTFNLCSSNMRYLSPEGYREMYRGYEIANHNKYHPFAIDPSAEYKLSEEAFDEQTASHEFIYRTDREGLYFYKYSPTSNYWSHIADKETYCALSDECKEELEEVFGKGSITAFVWPYRLQADKSVHEYLISRGYSSIRKTGDSPNFELPSDRMNWSYNAHHTNLTEKAELFEALEDDGRLYWFCFGVHSHDFENNNCWDVLERFADKYGNRPEDFWYATVRDVFEYEDAVKAATVTENTVVNNSEKTLYIKLNGKRITLFPHDTYNM